MFRYSATSIHDLTDHTHEALRVDNIKLAQQNAQLNAQVEELKARIVDIHAERIQAALDRSNGD